MQRLSSIISYIRERSGAWSSKIFIITLLAFLFFVTGGGISHNMRWRVEHINVSGANTVSVDAVRELVQEKLKGNYYFVYARDNSRLFPKKEIEQILLDTLPRLASATVNRIDDHTITALVTERTPYALWCGEKPNIGDVQINNCWFIDEEGFVFDQAPIFSKGVYIEVYGKLVEKKNGDPLRSILPRDRFASANTFAKLLRESVGKPFRIILKPEGELEVSVYTSAQYPFLSDTTMRFKDESNPVTLVKNLLSAIPVQFPNEVSMKKKLYYIDMRFGNKVIFGFEN